MYLHLTRNVFFIIVLYSVLGSDKSLHQDQQASSDDQNADIPLTLSQLSPHRAAPFRDPIPTPQDDVPISSSADDSSVAKNPSGGVLKSRLPVTRKHPKRISSNSSSLNRRKSTSTRPGIKRLPVFKPEGTELEDDSKDVASASSSSCATSRLQNLNEKDAEPVNSITLNNKGKRIVSGSSRVVSATNGVPLNSQMNRKGLDVGNNEDVQQSEKRYHIPDFKSMHAAQEAELALRKENTKPVVPIPIRWETEHRVRERQKFDERMREKEREEERLVEMRRKEREEREEREVGELRKKAVPKAHEVPEWYKEAPKKKKRINAIVD